MLLSADFLLAPDALLRNATLELTEEGRVKAVHRTRLPGATHYSGLLSPGFVNAHVHLELSHLKGHLAAGDGMAAFGGGVMRLRGTIAVEKREEAADQALKEAHASGTVAVFDIANGPDALAAKRNLQGRVYSHTGIEVFGSAPAVAEERFKGAEALLQAHQSAGLAGSIVPHAPYSLSGALSERVWAWAEQHPDVPLSVHVLESREERQLFHGQKGPLAEFIAKADGDLRAISMSADALQHLLPEKPVRNRLLAVHLTEAAPADLATLSTAAPATWFVLCPRSNTFIHQRFPAFGLFEAELHRLCFGTDSLASNHDLNVLEEVKCAQANHPRFSTEALLRAITQNGADALGVGDRLGRFTVGQAPGCVLVEPIGPNAELLPISGANLIQPAKFQH